ncbi:MAG: hypothetical protein ABFC31_07115 [Clostridiaceae bacterium]
MTKKSVVGCKYLCAAPVSSDVAGTLTYGTGFEIAELTSAALNITLASGELWTNNRLAYTKDRFSSGEFTPNIDVIPAAVAVSIFGCSMDGSEVVYNESDVPPYIGLAFYETLEDQAGTESYRCRLIVKAKAKLANKSVATKNNSVSFQTSDQPFKMFAATSGNWMIEEEFTTEAAAIAWVDDKLNVATIYRVDVMVQGTGLSADKDGVNFVAAGANLAITVTGTPTSMFDNSAVITLTEGVYTISTIAANHEVVFIKTA